MYPRIHRSRNGKKTVDPDTVPIGNSYCITKVRHLDSDWYTCHAVNKAIATKEGREVVSFYSTPVSKRSKFTPKQVTDACIENEIDHQLEAKHYGWELRYDIPMREDHVQSENNPKPF